MTDPTKMESPTNDEERQKRFVEDTTYQQRAATEPARKKVERDVKHFRQLWRREALDEIIAAKDHYPADHDFFPYYCAFQSMAYAAKERYVEGVEPLLRGIQAAWKQNLERVDPAIVAKLYNLLGCRLYQVTRLPEAGEMYAIRGWRLAQSSEKYQPYDVYPNVFTVIEMGILRARDGRADWSTVVRTADSYMTEICQDWPDYDRCEDFTGYAIRNVGLREWRERSKVFGRLFGQISL